MTKPLPKIGDSVKVALRGESPWAECIAVNADGSWLGRINNDLVRSEEHKLKFNDLVRFREKQFDAYSLWAPELDSRED